MFTLNMAFYSPTDPSNKREAADPVDPVAALQRRGGCRAAAAAARVPVLPLQRGPL